jgi:glycosyltransferase involved in cell wall biosynthesis
MRKKIFILADWFSPGFKAGGLVTALANLTRAVGERFELFVMTRDRDLGDLASYRGIAANEWREGENAKVYYTADFSFGNLRRQIERVQPDVLYLNSFFSSISVKTLLLRKLGLTAKVPVVIAPRGELSPGALAIKAGKKALYSRMAIRGGLYNGICWHASSDLESREIETFLESNGQQNEAIATASDIPSFTWNTTESRLARRAKSGSTRFVFISRISPKKNLLYALEALQTVPDEVEFDVFGPIDDASYWANCQRVIRTLPPNVTVRYRGAIARDDVASVLREHDFFLLPTQSENFGYAILEALAEGCPVLISDKTPWNDLAAQCAGWVMPLQERGVWAHAIAQCIAMDADTHAQMTARAREFVSAWLRRTNPAHETIEMFEAVLANPGALPQHAVADRSRHEEPAYVDPAREAAK